jgi:hypothetical protein
MTSNDISDGQVSVETCISPPDNMEQAADELIEKVLNDAKTLLHPLFRKTDLDCLSRRQEFIRAFKTSLERGIAARLAFWLDVQQITSSEFQHYTGYGAMLCAVYSIPIKVWPQNIVSA